MHPALAATLAAVDPEIAELIAGEERRQRDSVRLIASENYVSGAVLAATGTVLTNKYSEGYPGKRYYEGQQYIDQIETLCIDRAKSLFGAEHANVQPYSGSPANLAVYFAFLKPGDTVMGMGLPAGGHLTHGWNVSITGSYFKSVQYGVRKDTQRIDLDEVRELARKERPKLLFAGGTAIPRTIDFAAFGEIAREVGAIFVADIAHIAGLVAAGAHPSPVPIADVVSTTTHKTLRGPRGGLVLCKQERAQALDKSVFPGIQGGPFMHAIAAKADAFGEALQPSFRTYQEAVVANARVLGEELQRAGLRLVGGGTDTHLLLVDLRPRGLTGKAVEAYLDEIGITVNKNAIPFDPEKPAVASGIRLGTPAITSRGMGQDDAREIGRIIGAALDDVAGREHIAALHARVAELTAQFGVP